MEGWNMRIGIMGGSGYAGGELLRLLLSHPEAEIELVTSSRFAGEYVHMIHPNLRGSTKLKFTPSSVKAMAEGCDLVFLATPHGVSKDMVPAFLEAGIRVIDLSADFRLKDPADYPTWYGWEHPHPELLGEAVYGIPELHRERIREADLVACSGCMAGASILALTPLVKTGFVEKERIAIDVKIGSSGGGSDPTLASHHPERFGAIRPYKVVGHRHIAEIEQELAFAGGDGVRVGFTPHAVNMARGILATIHIWLTRPLENRDVWAAYRGAYSDEPFVRMVKSRKGLYQLPDPKVVAGTNFCDIGFQLDPHTDRLVVFSAIDNLVKGAAGQGVQCFNLMFGLDERMGLDYVGLH
jgi:N-acetyl-gamma-glutamyl-phosphate/LysW-gamma-L-alpha-aminoadipyl-6-phosphate reductase